MLSLTVLNAAAGTTRVFCYRLLGEIRLPPEIQGTAAKNTVKVLVERFLDPGFFIDFWPLNFYID
jgi:hypothetical protein